jgi:Glycosyltransferases involved in cell wall biogenesis
VKLLVSVIIAVYNGEKYISQAIESLFNQTYKNVEIILVDDGSTDNTSKIAKQYDNIKYIYQQNKGQSSARNLGISAANGEYLAFLDADDLYREDKIEKQVKILKENDNIHIVYNDLDVVDENLNYINTLKSEGVFKEREDLLAMILYRQVIQGPICMMIKRECMNYIKWREEILYASDYQYTIDLAQKYNFKYIEESLYIYRRHENNLSNLRQITFKEETGILKRIGVEKIKSIVYNSNFDFYNKKLLLARIYIKIGEYRSAKEILLEMSNKFKSEDIYFNLGNCSYNMNNFSEAKIFYKKAIEINCYMAEAYNNLGCTLGEYNKNKAQQCFEKALKLKEGYIDPHINIRNILENRNNFKITERELRKVLTLYK